MIFFLDSELKLVNILKIVSCVLINLYSVQWASRLNNLFGLGKVGALVLITGFGIYNLIIGENINKLSGYV